MSEGDKPKGSPIEAAGGLLWRSAPDGLKIALVHRPRYDDWTLPKGKLKPGESRLEAALREVKEETGYDASVLSFAGAIAYMTDKGPKIVTFWNMTINGEGQAEVDAGEVAKVEWPSPSEAMEQLSYPLEKAMVDGWKDEIVRALGGEVPEKRA